MPSRARACRRTARSPTPARPRAPRPRTRPTVRRLRDRPTAQWRSRCYLLLPAPRRLTPGQEAELVVGRAVAERPEALVALALLQPAVQQAGDRLGELLRRYAAEDRPGDRGI